MALSNIFREPRREITETVIGIATLSVIWIPAYLGANWSFAHEPDKVHNPWAMWFFVWLLLWPCLTLGGTAAAIFIHYVGEEVCNSLASRGLNLRPKRRY